MRVLHGGELRWRSWWDMDPNYSNMVPNWYYMLYSYAFLSTELWYISNLPFPGSLFGKLTVAFAPVLLPNKWNQITIYTLETANPPLERVKVRSWKAIKILKKHASAGESPEKSPARQITDLENIACNETLRSWDCSVRLGKHNKSPGIVKLLQRQGINNHLCPLTAEWETADLNFRKWD